MIPDSSRAASTGACTPIARVERPPSLEGKKEIGGRYDLAVRVFDRRPQLERVRPAVVGGGGDRGREVRHDGRSVGAGHAPVGGEAVPGEVEFPERRVVELVDRRAEFGDRDAERAAPVRGRGVARGHPKAAAIELEP